MKKILFCVAPMIFSSIIWGSTHQVINEQRELDTITSRVNGESKSIDYRVENIYGENNKVKQLESRISLLEDALDEFGAWSPERTAELWAKGFKNRNGALQYAVLCKEEKEKFKELMKNNSTWITGTSSPWVDRYEITKIQKKDFSTFQVTVKLYWATSSGSVEPSEKNLTIINNCKKWCISSIE